MKIIFEFNYNRKRLDDEPTYQHLDQVDNIPNLGDTVVWSLKDGETYWKVTQKSFHYINRKVDALWFQLEE